MAFKLQDLIKDVKFLLDDVVNTSQKISLTSDIENVKKQIKLNRLGQILLEKNAITYEQLQKALRVSVSTGQQLGMILLKEGFCNQKDINSALSEQKKRNRLGELLVNASIISKSELEQALVIQEETDKYLGQILIEHNFCSLERIVAVLKLKNEMYKLGQMLVMGEYITEEHLKEALKIQKQTGKLLGDILIEQGYATKPQVHSAIRRQSYQSRLGNILVSMGFINNEQLERALTIQNTTGRLLGDILVKEGFCYEEDMVKALKYKRELSRIGKMLLNSRVIKKSQLNEALLIQEETGQKLGNILVNLGYTTHARIEEVIRGFKEFRGHHLGQNLLMAGIINQEQLNRALDIQERSNRPLGEILIDIDACTAEQLSEAMESQTMAVKIVDSILQ